MTESLWMFAWLSDTAAPSSTICWVSPVTFSVVVPATVTIAPASSLIDPTPLRLRLPVATAPARLIALPSWTDTLAPETFSVPKLAVGTIVMFDAAVRVAAPLTSMTLWVPVLTMLFVD